MNIGLCFIIQNKIQKKLLVIQTIFYSLLSVYVNLFDKRFISNDGMTQIRVFAFPRRRGRLCRSLINQKIATVKK